MVWWGGDWVKWVIYGYKIKGFDVFLGANLGCERGEVQNKKQCVFLSQCGSGLPLVYLKKFRGAYSLKHPHTEYKSVKNTYFSLLYTIQYLFRFNTFCANCYIAMHCKKYYTSSR